AGCPFEACKTRLPAQVKLASGGEAMNGTIWGHVIRLAAVCILWQATAAFSAAQSSGLTVTATAGAPSASPVPVGVEITATLTATADNVPASTSYCQVGPPTWFWGYQVEFATTPGQWGSPPPGAQVSIDPPPSQNPSVTKLHATFPKAGYWRITAVKATVMYYDSCGNTWTASGTANDVEVTVVSVTISPNPIYVSVGGSALPTVTVTPAGAAGAVSFDTSDSSIATVEGTAPYVTVWGIATGT